MSNIWSLEGEYTLDFEEEARFQSSLGKKIIKTESCYWLKLYSANVYLSWPPDFIYSVKRSTINALLSQHPFSAFTLTNERRGAEGYVWCAKSPYDLSSLQKKARNQTRRGLENCEIRKVDWNSLAKEGPRINKSSVIRQKRKGFYNPIFLGEQAWFADCMCCSKFNDITAWGAYVGKHLVAYLTVQVFDDGCARIRSHASDSDFLRFNPNNALIFAVTKHLLSKNNTNCVTYGAKSDDPHLEHFKGNMRFFKKKHYSHTFFLPSYFLHRIYLQKQFNLDTLIKTLKLICEASQSFFLSTFI